MRCFVLRDETQRDTPGHAADRFEVLQAQSEQHAQHRGRERPKDPVRGELQHHRWLEKRDDGQRDEPHGNQIVEPVEEAIHERAQGRGGSFAE